MNTTYSVDAKYWLALADSVSDTTLFALLRGFENPPVILNTSKQE